MPAPSRARPESPPAVCAMPPPLVLVHGYSDKGASFSRWREALGAAGHDVTAVHTCEYETLTNEVSIKDIAEGLDRTLRMEPALGEDGPFDAVVHSTGMLVLRAWLATYPRRRDRLKRLVALAPASFGSPLAHKGRSWLGRLFKGRKEPGPDFMEAGDLVLDGLELGGRFTWDLAHQDLVGEAARQRPTFGPDGDTPFVFTFCGDKGYRGLRSLINEPGSDGTVRWAGCPLDTRKVTVDLTAAPAGDRVHVEPWAPGPWSLVPAPGHNHASILQDPSPALVQMVRAALDVETAADYARWQRAATRAVGPAREAMHRYQQFVVRALDERGDPVPDYAVELAQRDGRGRLKRVKAFDLDVHVYGADPSLRCFHVDLERLNPDGLDNLWVRVAASSGSQLVGYHGHGAEADAFWNAALDLTPLLRDAGVTFFYPHTTTLVELRLNREPMPLEGRNQVLWFVEGEA